MATVIVICSECYKYLWSRLWKLNCRVPPYFYSNVLLLCLLCECKCKYNNSSPSIVCAFYILWDVVSTVPNTSPTAKFCSHLNRCWNSKKFNRSVSISPRSIIVTWATIRVGAVGRIFCIGENILVRRPLCLNYSCVVKYFYSQKTLPISDKQACTIVLSKILVGDRIVLLKTTLTITIARRGRRATEWVPRRWTTTRVYLAEDFQTLIVPALKQLMTAVWTCSTKICAPKLKMYIIS